MATSLRRCPTDALIGPSQSIKLGSVPPPYKNQAREASPIIFLPTTYAPTFSGFCPPLAWRGRTVGISVNARISIGCQQRLTRMPPPPFQKKPLRPSALSPPPPLTTAKRLIHVWLSDVNRELFLEMLVRIERTRGAVWLAGLLNRSQTAARGGKSLSGGK